MASIQTFLLKEDPQRSVFFWKKKAALKIMKKWTNRNQEINYCHHGKNLRAIVFSNIAHKCQARSLGTHQRSSCHRSLLAPSHS
jgi:deoxyribodipyrimidine photolyase-like uncharacterized protein